MGCLRGRTLNKEEKYRFRHLAALASVFDDLTDSFREEGTRSPIQHRYSLAEHLLRQLRQSLPISQLAPFDALVARVYRVETHWPQTQGLTEQIHLTKEKGGASVLLFRSVLDGPISGPEAHALFEFGGLIQWCDDLFDCWHDRQKGHATLVTRLMMARKWNVLQKIFDRQVRVVHQSLRNTAFPAQQTRTTAYVLHFLVSITQVCLQHYQYMAATESGFPWHSRTLMVVDMAKWGNRLRAARHLFRPFG